MESEVPDKPGEEPLDRTHPKQDSLREDMHPLTEEVNGLFAREAIEVNVPDNKGTVTHCSVEALAVCREDTRAAR